MIHIKLHSFRYAQGTINLIKVISNPSTGSWISINTTEHGEVSGALQYFSYFDCDVVIANPKYVKGIRGKKTDKQDSIWLCDLHKFKLSPPCKLSKTIKYEHSLNVLISPCFKDLL